MKGARLLMIILLPSDSSENRSLPTIIHQKHSVLGLSVCVWWNSTRKSSNFEALQLEAPPFI